jgi:hypothetical protein
MKFFVGFFVCVLVRTWQFFGVNRFFNIGKPFLLKNGFGTALDKIRKLNTGRA